MFNKLKLFLIESRAEFKRVNWPTRDEMVKMVILVIVISLAVAAFLGALDFLNIYILNNVIR
jgi:preprotein translocase subunit SecE